MRRMLSRAVCAVIPAIVCAAAGTDTVLREIFSSHAFAVHSFEMGRWIEGGAAYTNVEGSAIVAYRTASGQRAEWASAKQLTPAGASAPLHVDDYFFSADLHRILIFTNARRVWRQNTRGDYWVFDRGRGSLKKVGGGAPAASLMFAKFSPDGSRVGYVRENNIYTEDLESGAIAAVTTDGSATIINGTSDWVYEEELKVRDCFLWSPDGRSIAYWQFDISGVPKFPLINNTDSRVPMITWIPYPQTGQTNSAARIGVASASGGPTTWMKVPGDPRNHYLFRLAWTPDGQELLIGQLNRPQNNLKLFLAVPGTGATRNLFEESDPAWVDVREAVRLRTEPAPLWSRDGKDLLWLSERDGWRQLYSVSRESGAVKRMTGNAADVISLEGLDPESLYAIECPDDPIRRYLYRTRLDRPDAAERITPADEPGSHSYVVSPDCRYAFHTYSAFDRAPVTDLVTLPDHRVVRVLEENASAREAFTKLAFPAVEFFRVKLPGGVVLDGDLLKPRGFDATKKYPVIVYVYGEPASAVVVDQWGGDRALFNRALASEGYLVVSFDNRGTPAPKGRAWRKAIYQKIGVLPTAEQTEALELFLRERPYADRERIGVWGWSSGGSNTLNLMFRSPDVYRVGVAVAPVPDLRLYDSIYQERYLGLPDASPEVYAAGSSVNFAAGLNGKLLLVHGSGDDNVHYQGSEMLINRLVELDKPFEFMEYPNRSHTLSEGAGTLLHLHQMIVRFFDENLARN